MTHYRHVDVFTDVPYRGNGLIVLFGDATSFSSETLISLTAELRQFESIVVDLEADAPRIGARVFTAQEELPFAGHPLIGAAAAVHELHPADPECEWVFTVAAREIVVRSQRSERYYRAEMNQGAAGLGSALAHADAIRFAHALNLDDGDMHALPMQVVSTGLPYLIVPVARGLERARIVVDDFEERLASVGAKFVYVLDPAKPEGRTWDNGGAIEDVATGSAAGPAAAYLAAHGLGTDDGSFVIHQGRFVGRPSRIAVTLDDAGDLWVGGPVAPVARGVIDGGPRVVCHRASKGIWRVPSGYGLERNCSSLSKLSVQPSR